METENFHPIERNPATQFRINNSRDQDKTFDASRPVEKYLLKILPQTPRFDAYDLLTGSFKNTPCDLFL